MEPLLPAWTSSADTQLDIFGLPSSSISCVLALYLYIGLPSSRHAFGTMSVRIQYMVSSAYYTCEYMISRAFLVAVGGQTDVHDGNTTKYTSAAVARVVSFVQQEGQP